MGVTYTRTADRVRPRSTAAAASPHVALLVTSVVSVLALALCYTGRLHAFDAAGPSTTGRTVVNLSHRPAAREIEPALAAVFGDATDRAFAANAIAAAVASGGPVDAPANVGALARLTAPTAAIAGTRGLVAYAARLDDARRRAGTGAVPATLPLFSATEFSTIKPAFIVRTRADHRRAVLWCVIGLIASLHVIALTWTVARRKGDPILLASVHVLVTLGALVMLSRPDPLRDTLLLVHFTSSVVLASAACAALSLVRVRTASFLHVPYLALGAAITLALLLAVFGSGPGTSGAKVNLGPMQPVELIRLLLAFFLAGYLGRRWELVRQVRETAWRTTSLPEWLNVPRIDQLVPVLGGVAIALILFFVLHDLGPALLLALSFFLLFAIARAGSGAVIVGLAVLAGGFALGYWLDVSGTLTGRIVMWLSPWQNAARGGDQVAQAVWAMATGAFKGTGLGLGDARYLPAGHTDLVLAAVGEELGFVGVVVAALAGALVAARGFRIAREAPTDTTCFLAIALTLSLVLPMLVMGAGMLGLLPLTGVVTPFVSYGGSAMLVNFTAIGLLAAIASDGGPACDTLPFARSMRWTGHALAACAVVILAFAARAQLFAADALVVRPQLGIQADGGLRYQYNPRVLDAASTLPRGAIRDRHNVPIAGDPAIVRQAQPALARIGIAGDPCPDPAARCYPLGGRAFDLLGDATTHVNWAASNSSYVERDADDNLRGFDDRAVVVRIAGSEGHATAAVKRDYRALLPLVRHRWEPEHEAVRALRAQPRDVRLTIDAGLQIRVSSILAHAAATANVTHAAAVVLDAASGDVLASVSYPWPADDASDVPPSADALLDRARYGLYPPGSTFKLITAAAALRLDPGSSSLAFTCSRLSDDRVGVKLPGSGRPIRDDVRDRHPHGTLTMHDALVRSCNAYFAQLAVKLGVEPLARTADLAGIIFPTSGSGSHVRDTLPYSGYGQGDVLASPLRMARVAAALASNGTILDTPLVEGDAAPDPKAFVPASTAHLLAGYMRDAVTDGTGRLLATHPMHIAGKTGTAEVQDARSHAWFIGFAPATPGARRIAFAVLLENAGYGGASAAAVAGEVVTAAASAGLLR